MASRHVAARMPSLLGCQKPPGQALLVPVMGLVQWAYDNRTAIETAFEAFAEGA